jgi:hypothetical protein
LLRKFNSLISGPYEKRGFVVPFKGRPPGRFSYFVRKEEIKQNKKTYSKINKNMLESKADKRTDKQGG